MRDGNTRSYRTTHGHGYSYKNVEDYVFIANGLTALPDDIALITTRMLNDALDNAKGNLGNKAERVIRNKVTVSEIHLANLERKKAGVLGDNAIVVVTI